MPNASGGRFLGDGFFAYVIGGSWLRFGFA
jgi:hypothetical protein